MAFDYHDQDFVTLENRESTKLILSELDKKVKNNDKDD